MSTYTSHASDSEIDSIKPVIVDTTCLENSCLTNHVMPNSKIQVHKLMVSLSLLVIIVGRFVILGQIVIF
jgi:hypothetical protein